MTWLLPSPTSGTSGVPASEQQNQIAHFFGEDIYFDIAAPDVELGEADYIITPTGDWLTVTGEEALRQSLIRRIVTNPGEWATKPNYGVGARQYVKAKNTKTTRAELESRIRAQFLFDQRVERVDLVVVEQLEDGSAGVKIEVHVTPRGRLRGDKPLPVRLEVR